jgi:transposase-like protein
MTQRDYKAFLEKWLTRFLLEDDPIKAMLEWLLGELMKVEAEAKVGAPKGKHSRERKTNFSGYMMRDLRGRVGTLDLAIPKVSKGGVDCYLRLVTCYLIYNMKTEPMITPRSG